MKRQLAIVVSHPIQYYAPWFRHLAANTDLGLRVFYLSDHGVKTQHDAHFHTDFAWDTDLISGYAHEFVPNLSRHPDVTRFSGLHNPGLRAALCDFAPDAILLFGYAYRTHLNLILRSRAPLLFRGDSHLLGQPDPPWLKRTALRWIYRRFAAVTFVGQANRAYFRGFGVPDSKLFFAPHCVDDAHYQPTVTREKEAEDLRATLGIANTAPVVLFAGKMSAKKRPDLLLAAFQETSASHAHLVLAGDGELLPALKAMARDHERIHFLPFANQSAMPSRYLMGDVFVLPSEGSYETWGLAVNEAMHMARPVIVSDVVGCQRDLVPDERTGWVFPAGDRHALTRLLQKVLQMSRGDLLQRGRSARQHAAAYNYENATAGLLQALAFASHGAS